MHWVASANAKQLTTESMTFLRKQNSLMKLLDKLSLSRSMVKFRLFGALFVLRGKPPQDKHPCEPYAAHR